MLAYKHWSLSFLRALACMLAMWNSAHAQNNCGALCRFRLPRNTMDLMVKIAEQSDILILGEVHGTREVPEIVVNLLGPLTRLGYRALAVEIPSDQRASLTAWANGQTAVLPDFFLDPVGDGRGNAQSLALIRMALSPPFRWKLICFDQADVDAQRRLNELRSGAGQEQTGNPLGDLNTNWVIAYGIQRDAAMASNLLSQRRELPSHTKVLAICGDLHARMTNDLPPENSLSAFWPSFAAVLHEDPASINVTSININPHRGTYINEGKIKLLNDYQISTIDIHQLSANRWCLDLPFASAASLSVPPTLNSVHPESSIVVARERQASNCICSKLVSRGHGVRRIFFRRDNRMRRI